MSNKKGNNKGFNSADIMEVLLQMQAKLAESEVKADAQQAKADAQQAKADARHEELSKKIDIVTEKLENIETQVLCIKGVVLSSYPCIKPETHKELTGGAEKIVKHLDELDEAGFTDEEKEEYVKDEPKAQCDVMAAESLKDIASSKKVQLVDYRSLTTGEKITFSKFVADEVKKVFGKYFYSHVLKSKGNSLFYPVYTLDFIVALTYYYFDAEQYGKAPITQARLHKN